MEREERELERDPDREERERDRNRARVGHIRQQLGQVHHVQRPGHDVHQADADDDERRADAAHDQVLVRRRERSPVLP